MKQAVVRQTRMFPKDVGKHATNAILNLHRYAHYVSVENLHSRGKTNVQFVAPENIRIQAGAVCVYLAPKGKNWQTWERLHDFSDCKMCIAGQRNGIDASTSCKKCDGGRHLTDPSPNAAFGHDDESDCKICNAGKWSTMGNSACKNCADNSVQNISGQVACLECPSGRFTLQRDRSSDHDSENDCYLSPMIYRINPNSSSTLGNVTTSFYGENFIDANATITITTNGQLSTNIKYQNSTWMTAMSARC